jgi:hypothetical protein
MPLSLWPSLWAEPRAPGAPARSWRDWALAGVFCLLAIIEGLTRPDLPGGFGAVLLVFLLAPTLLWRRSHPLLMVAIAFTATFVAPLFTGGVPPEVPRSTWTSMSSRRCGRERAASCSRRPAPTCSTRRYAPPRPATR